LILRNVLLMFIIIRKEMSSFDVICLRVENIESERGVRRRLEKITYRGTL